MLVDGLAMLWEDTEPQEALRSRFGFDDRDEALGWLSAVLPQVWGVHVETCDRLLLSATNALAWVGTDAGAFVVKIAAHAPDFARLDAVAALVQRLERAGLPVAAPVPTLSGAARAVHEADRPLSVAVLPRIDGDLLDVDDLEAVQATGELVGRLHEALADIDPAGFGRGRLDWGDDPRIALAAWLERIPHEVAPRARAALADLVGTLPDLDSAHQLVHGDVRGANVLVRDHQVAALLDFDELGTGRPVIELASAAVMLATEFRRWPPAPVAAQEALIAGYERVRPLTAAERGWCTAARLAIGFSQVRPGDPEGWAAVVDSIAEGA